MSRPSSGVSKRNRSASTRSQSPFVYGNQDAEEPESRPTTAGGSRGAIGIEFLRNMSKSAKYLERPRTAGSEYGRFYHAVDPSYPSTPQLLDAGQTTFMNEPFKPRNSEKEILVGRYYGYFYQKRPWEEGTPLGEPVIEKKIARRVTIHYYIKDDTIEINEPKQINSGMPSGRFYRRNKLYKENSDEFITMADLVPGKSFRALGQEIFVADADAFTRDYAK